MEYKRLTKRINTVVVYPYGEYEDTTTAEMTTSDIRAVMQRLAELEDKMEQGLMLELPCKVGDTVYYISMIWRDENFIGEIYKANVSGFYISDGLIQIEDDIIYHYHNYGEEVFLTKAEAEQKLKELKGEV